MISVPRRSGKLSLDGYRSTQVLRDSERARVYAAVRESDQRRVLVKVYDLDDLDGLEVRIEHEFRLIHGLELEGIVSALSYQRSANELALVLDWCEGVTLEEYRAGRPLPVADFMLIAVQLARILAELHRYKVIHRNIKPSNVFIDPQTKAVSLGDFGISVVLESERQRINDPWVIDSILPYVSPEQTGRTHHEVDFRSDLYSLGVSFYELLVGRRPFEATTPLELIHAHLARRPQTPQRLRPDQLLTRSDEQLEPIRAKLLARLGPSSFVLHELVPKLRPILGAIPAMPEIGPVESRNQLALACAGLIAEFARVEHPLVLSLDDLQWGIEQRHLEVSVEEIESRGGWYRLVNAATLSIATRALTKLIRDDLPADSFDALVVVSASYAGFPSLSRLLQTELGLRPDALCYDLTGLGCAGPTHGLHLADMLVTTGAAQRVCVVCADVMGTHGESRVHNQVPNMSQLVAHCLASDGAGAVVVSAEPSSSDDISWDGCRLDTRLWPNSLAENDFTASEDNQPLISVGKEIRTRLLDELGPTVAAADPETTYFHPGGTALMRQLGANFPAFGPTLEISSKVLREHGNIGSASVLWVLHDAWKIHDAGQREFGPDLRLIALGPGIVSTQLTLTGVGTGVRTAVDD